MNKQELIKHFEDLPYVSITQMGKKSFIDMIEQLDEPQKVVIPKFVAEWYEEHKDSLEFSIFDYVYRINEKEESVFKKWFVDSTTRPFQILVNMHQFGYEVDEEPKYIVKMKGVSSLFRYLKYSLLTEKWYMGNDTENEDVKKTHTRKEIEDAGFGEVFNSPLFEVEEVTE